MPVPLLGGVGGGAVHGKGLLEKMQLLSLALFSIAWSMCLAPSSDCGWSAAFPPSAAALLRRTSRPLPPQRWPAAQEFRRVLGIVPRGSGVNAALLLRTAECSTPQRVSRQRSSGNFPSRSHGRDHCGLGQAALLSLAEPPR